MYRLTRIVVLVVAGVMAFGAQFVIVPTASAAGKSCPEGQKLVVLTTDRHNNPKRTKCVVSVVPVTPKQATPVQATVIPIPAANQLPPWMTLCSDRPPMTIVMHRVATGEMRVTLSTTTNETASPNPLLGVRFDKFDNVKVAVGGREVAPGEVFLLSNTSSFSFFVRRINPGQPALAYLTGADFCGNWETFVGGGRNAF